MGGSGDMIVVDVRGDARKQLLLEESAAAAMTEDPAGVDDLRHGDAQDSPFASVAHRVWTRGWSAAATRYW